MARIAGIDLPKNKRGVIGLTYIYGIGRSTAENILAEAGIDESVKVQDWNALLFVLRLIFFLLFQILQIYILVSI